VTQDGSHECPKDCIVSRASWIRQERSGRLAVGKRRAELAKSRVQCDTKARRSAMPEQ
jgi:hypothetical protein